MDAIAANPIHAAVLGKTMGNPALRAAQSRLAWREHRRSCYSLQARHNKRLSWRDGASVLGERMVSPEYNCQLLSKATRRSRSGALSMRAFTDRQADLVKESWDILRKDAGHHALAMFLRVFDIAPSAKRLFSFLGESDEVPLEKNPQLKSHALKVFVIICEAATSLKNKGEVSTPGSTMKNMAHSHAVSGVVDEHYDVVKYCLLKTIKEGLPADKWSKEVEEAWAEAYSELVDAIKAEFKAGREKESVPPTTQYSAP